MELKNKMTDKSQKAVDEFAEDQELIVVVWFKGFVGDDEDSLKFEKEVIKYQNSCDDYLISEKIEFASSIYLYRFKYCLGIPVYINKKQLKELNSLKSSKIIEEFEFTRVTDRVDVKVSDSEVELEDCDSDVMPNPPLNAMIDDDCDTIVNYKSGDITTSIIPFLLLLSFPSIIAIILFGILMVFL